MDLKGRSALVTGSGRRVGRAIALGLARAGMRVAIHYHASADEARETLRLVQDAGGTGELFEADLRESGAPEKLVSAVARSFGGLDVLVNSAAIMRRTPVGETTVADWDEMFALNLRAPFFACQAAAQVMKERGGAIVNIADLAAFETWTGYIPHSITKAGIVQLTRALAHALAPTIRVNAVAPGAVLLPDGWSEESGEHLIETTPLRRLGSPQDVVDAVLYLLRADYITGETIIVDGGRHVRR